MKKQNLCSRYFRKEYLDLEHPNPSRFAHGPWKPGRVHPLYLAYRFIVSLYLASSMVWGARDLFRNGKWFIFLTSWSYAAITVYNVLSTYVSLQEYLWERKHAKNGSPCPQRYQTMPQLYKVNWVLYNASVSLAISVSTLYWGFTYNTEIYNQPFTPVIAAFVRDQEVNNGLFHIGNTVYSLVEICVGAPPMKFLHVYQMLIYATIYLIFSLIYCALGGSDATGEHCVYAAMDWNDPPSAIRAVGVCLVVLIIIHLLTLVLCRIRSRIVTIIKNIL